MEKIMRRKVDPLGRIILPAEFRTRLGIEKDSEIEIVCEKDRMIIKKYPLWGLLSRCPGISKAKPAAVPFLCQPGCGPGPRLTKGLGSCRIKRPPRASILKKQEAVLMKPAYQTVIFDIDGTLLNPTGA